MKKSIFLGLAAVAALGFTACNSSSCNGSASCAKDGKGGDKSVLYVGILPAADVQATVTTLKLEYDDDHNYTDGDFVMVENSLAADTVAVSGLTDAASSYTEGDFRKETKTVNGATVEYLVLTPDAKDGLGAASTTPTYLVVNADGSLTLVNSDIEMPANPALYTLAVK